ncbi:hypothetical protein ABXK36_38510, partial [Bacillus cereus]
IDCIFELHKGKVDVELSGKSSLKITLTQKDFLEWIEAKSYLKEFESLDNVLNMVGVDNQNLTGKKKLTITFETKKFIKFDKGLSLVSFRLDYTIQEKREYTRRFLQKENNKEQSQHLELVNLSYSKHF